MYKINNKSTNNIAEVLKKDSSGILGRNFVEQDQKRAVSDQISTANITINQDVIETNYLIVGTQEVVVSPGDDIQAKIDSIATTGGIVSLRNGLYTITTDINIPSGVYLRGETLYGVVLDFVDNTHGVKIVGDNAYTTGTVSINPGETAVIGVGTEWLTYAAAGQYILVGQSWALIAEVVSDTEITIELPFGWEPVSGDTYTIASIVYGVEFKNATILNADKAIDFQYVYNFTISGVITSLCNTGIYGKSIASYDIINSYNLFNGISIDITDAHLMKGDNFYSLGSQVSHGISFDKLENSTIHNTVTSGNALDGFHIVNSSNVVVDGTFLQNGNDAIYMESCSDVVINNAATESNVASGVELVSCSNITLDTVSSNGNGGNGLTVTGTTQLAVVGGHYSTNYGYGISIDATSGDNIIAASGVTDNLTGDLNDLGTNTRTSGNLGLETEDLNTVLPDQAGNTGKVLKTDGTDATWQTETLTSETDPVFSVSEAASFVAGDKSKLDGIDTGAEVNNISDVNATDLTDSGATTLHKHSYSNLDDKPTLGTAAAKNIPATGDASITEVVYGTDTRLTDSRTPSSHGNEAHSSTFITAGDIPAIPDSVDDIGPSQTGNSGKFLSTDGSNASWAAVPGGGGFSWTAVTSDGNLTVNTGTLANKGTLLTLTLPATASVGDTVRVAGMNAGLWKIAQNASGIIHFRNLDSTTGASGYISSTKTYDAVELVCVVANNEWAVVSSVGNITVA